jgi:hypothetical protein
MAKDVLRIAAPDPTRDREALLDLVCKTFQNYFGFMTYCRDRYVLNSHLDWAASRVGFIGEQMITSFCVWDYQMRIGVGRVRTGGIGVVATHADHRKKGYMDQTARAGVVAMRAAGYDMSVLFGVWDFYDRFGYTRAWAGHEMSANVAQLPTEKPARKIRKIDYTTGPELSRLYNKYHSASTGTAVRPTYTKARTDGGAYGWNDAGGQLAGYFAFEGAAPRLDVFDAVGEPEQVLRAIAQVAREMGRTEVKFPNLPALEPLARELRRGTCREEYRWVKRGDAMALIVDLPATFEKTRRELARRVQGSLLEDWRGELTVFHHKEHVTLRLDGRGGVSVLPAGAEVSRHTVRAGAELAQLVLGTTDPLEIVAQHGTKLAGDAKKLLPVLFPYQAPMLEGPDHF